MKRKLIRVTKEDIEWGRRRQSTQCPVALACQRAGYLHPSVGTTSLSLRCPEDPSQYMTAKLSSRVAAMVARFDNGRKIKPFSFYLTLREYSYQ